VRQIALTCGAGAAAISVLASGLVGCHVGPNYHLPNLPTGADASLVSLDTTIENTATPPDSWWRLYNDPQLDALVREALMANRDLRAADANLAAAQAVVTEVHAARYPSTEAIAGGVYGRDPVTNEILEFGGHRPQRLWLFEDLFQVAYEVDLFGRVHRAIEQANASADSVAAARDGVRVFVAAQTARTYAQICALGEQLGVARHSLEIVTREAHITQQRYSAGQSSEFEVERAQALVEEVRATIPQLSGLRRVALFELTALLGRTPVSAPRELESCMMPPHLTALIPVGDGRALISRRPDVRQAERRLAASTARIGVATAELYPTIRLSAFYGGTGSELSQLTTNAGLSWGIGPSISWTFPNQVRARAQIQQAKAGQAAALASFDSAVLTALKETEQALTAYSAALDQHQALLRAQARIHRSFDIARAESAAGSLSPLDLLTTEQSLVALDAAVASSNSALIDDQIITFKALGGGWRSDEQPPR
jgi:NodT family efflux transporter outer membrane factor (OMF) lipoprotein